MIYQKMKNILCVRNWEYLNQNWVVFLKKNDEWTQRMSGMTFNIKNLDYYKKLKEYLNKEFNKFERKQKLMKIIENA